MVQTPADIDMSPKICRLFYENEGGGGEGGWWIKGRLELFLKFIKFDERKASFVKITIYAPQVVPLLHTPSYKKTIPGWK